jgi:hypothetical protein
VQSLASLLDAFTVQGDGRYEWAAAVPDLAAGDRAFVAQDERDFE